MSADPWAIAGTIAGMLAVGTPAVFALGRAFGRIDELTRLLRELKEAKRDQGERVGELEAAVARLNERTGTRAPVGPRLRRRGTKGVPIHLEPEESTEG